MAEYWVDSRVAEAGDGSSIGAPLQAVPSNAFGAGHVWNLKYGSSWDLAASPLTSGNSATVRAYGTASDGKPVFTGTNANMFSCSTATGAVVFEDIAFVRSGAQAGIGILATLMSGAGASFTIRRCLVSGFETNIRAVRTRSLTVEDCTISTGNSGFGIRGQAFENNNAENWRITGNTFDCGTDIDVYVSDTACTNGSFINLVIEDNTMIFSGASGGTSMILQGIGNATNYGATASVQVDTPSPGVHTLTRDTGGAWPQWAAGTVIFLAGWDEPENFGTVTVTGGGNTTTVTVTDLGASLVTETTGNGKGCGVRDPLRAFINPSIKRNVIKNRGLTPMFIHNFIGGVLEGNTFADMLATGLFAACIEAFNCVGTVARNNIVRNITGYVVADGNGIFWDGACEDCVAHGNHISGVRTTSDTPFNNYGVAMALFFSRNCLFHSNIVEDCNKGIDSGGVATVGEANNNTISGCAIGYAGASNLTAGSIVFKNNVVQKCDTGIVDGGSSTMSTNAWWANTVNVLTGTLAAKDAEAITADPMLSESLRLMPGSPLIGAGLHLGYKRDFNGVQRPNPPSVGAHDVAQLRNSP